MKKRLSGYKLNRDTKGRLALLRSLLQSMVQKESIVTSSAKAKAIRPLFEKLLTKARANTLATRRAIQAELQSSSLTKRLVDDIAKRYEGVRGGYTSMVPVGARRGDNSPLVRLSLTKRTLPTSTTSKATDADKSEKLTKTPTSLAAPKTAKVAPTKAAPKLVRRTGRRGDK